MKQRDRQSIELKFRYMLARNRPERRQTYDVSVYFFLPYSFNIHPASYDRARFYDDLKLYLRFNTPTFTAAELLSPRSRSSPLARVERMVRAARKGRAPIDVGECIYEGKLLGSIYKTMLRDAVTGNASRKPATVVDAMKEVRTVSRRFRRITATLQRKVQDADPAVIQHTRMIDEHLSLLIEKYATVLLQRLRREGSADLEQTVARIIAREMTYREKAGYPTVIRGTADEGKLEEHISREKILKRYASEVLFFDVRRRNTGKGIEQLLYAFAAGIAMVFATGMAFLGQSAYGRLTTSLFIVLVISYMLKDRMKDFFRDVFRKSLGQRFYDRSARLFDSRHQRKLAQVKERASFVRADRIDSRVMTLRNQGSFEQALSRTTAESIFRYSKRIALNGRTMKGIHRRIVGVADISIIDLGHFLHHLASQRGLVPVLTERNEVELSPVKRIYHLNMIVNMKGQDTNDYYRYRLVVDAGGIIRVESVTDRGTM